MESLQKSFINAALAVKIWGGWYNFNSDLGVGRQAWLGIQLCLIAVLISLSVLIRSMKITGFSATLSLGAVKLFIMSGIVFLYASEHLRDAFVLLLVSGLFLGFLQVANKTKLTSVIFVWVISVLFVMAMTFLRIKFVLLPAVFLVLYLFARPAQFSVKQLFLSLLFLTPLLVVGGYFEMFDRVTDMLDSNSRNYGELALSQSGSNSLGYTLIMDRPPLVRAILGFFYLHFQPIPFWVGFDSPSTYHWFKSIYSLFNHVTLPYALLACFLYARGLFSKRYLLVPIGIRFSILVYLASFAGVAMSSVETRHAGVFLVPYIIVVCYGFNSMYELGRWRKLYFKTYWLCVGFIYGAWLMLKYLI